MKANKFKRAIEVAYRQGLRVGRLSIEDAIKAMEEYASQETASLKARVVALEAAVKGLVDEITQPDYPLHSGMTIVWIDKVKIALSKPINEEK